MSYRQRHAIKSPVILAFIFVTLLCATPLFAVPARNVVETVVQPDGTAIPVRQFGDEWSNGLRTLDGYTILHDRATGHWRYAEEDPRGQIVLSPFIVGREQPFGIRPNLAPRAQRVGGSVPIPTAQSVQGAMPAPQHGNQPLLVLFVDFTPSVKVGSTATSLATKFFGATSSVKHYFETVSYGQFSITPAQETEGTANDGIVSVTLGTAHPNTAATIDDRNRSITRNALLAADGFVNFAQFDTNNDGVLSSTELHIIVVVAGYERSYSSSPCGASVWGHRWVLSGAVPAPILDGKVVGQTYAQFGENHCAGTPGTGHEATIGIMAHELGHDLGLPDLYDTDGSSRGIGDWSIMAGGSWGRVSLSGDSPSHFDPWSKYFLGWISPTLVSGTTLTNEPITQSATTPDIYQLSQGAPFSGEYFLVENRQRVNYDASLPSAGLLIWHVDADINTSNNTDNASECYPGGPSCATGHYKVALVQADNLYNLEKNQNGGDAGDPWPGTSGNTEFDGTSSPNSNFYSGSSSNISVTAISASGPTMTATLSQSTNGVSSISPNPVDLAAPPASFTITGGGFADFGFGLPAVNFTRGGFIIAAVRASAGTSTSLTVPFPAGLIRRTLDVEVYNQTGASSWSLVGITSLTVTDTRPVVNIAAITSVPTLTDCSAITD